MTTATFSSSEIAEAAQAAADNLLDTVQSDRMAALAVMAKECRGGNITMSLDDFALLADYYPKT